jgi:hypothetical protein
MDQERKEITLPKLDLLVFRLAFCVLKHPTVRMKYIYFITFLYYDCQTSVSSDLTIN